VKGETSLTPPPSTSLSDVQFSTLNIVGINDPEGPEKAIQNTLIYILTKYIVTSECLKPVEGVCVILV
jgi:hypothetical protein